MLQDARPPSTSGVATAEGEVDSTSALPAVLHLIGSLDRGGTEQQLVEFIRRSSHPERHAVCCFAGTGDGSLVERLPSPPVYVGPLRRGSALALDLPRVVREIRSKISERGIGLVHAHLGFSELLAGVAVPKEIPLVASRRGRNLGYEDRSWFRLLEDASHRRVALLLCNSEELASFTLAHDGSPPPVVVIPNGVDLERFALTPFASGPPTVSVVANLLSYKRHDLFLRAFALVTRWTPEARATLVGDGAERGRLEMLADDLGLSNSVLFAGRLDDPRPFIAEAHAVALTSIHEGLPNALLEAMAMGRPTVATPVGGIPELVRDGNEGLLAEARPEAVAEALIRVLGDRDRAEAMGRAARARAEAFGWESVVLRTEDAYRLVLRGEVLPRARRVA